MGAPKPHLVRHQKPLSDLAYPHDLDAERAVLGAIVIDNRHLVTASEFVTVGDFYRDAHQRIFRVMLTMQSHGTAIDFLTLKHALAGLGELDEVGGPAYLSSLGDAIPRALNVPYYAGIVRQCAARRAIIDAANQLARAAHEQDVDVSESRSRETVKAVAALGQRQFGTPVLVNMAQIERQDVRWLWANRPAAPLRIGTAQIADWVPRRSEYARRTWLIAAGTSLPADLDAGSTTRGAVAGVTAGDNLDPE
jgi:hypothetical protein